MRHYKFGLYVIFLGQLIFRALYIGINSCGGFSANSKVYFETSTQDEIRDFGFFKDGKHRHVQIMLAAIVTKEGLPIDYGTGCNPKF